MNILFLVLGLIFVSETDNKNAKWGQIGHYVTGYIAEQHMSDKALDRVNEILGDTSIPLATVWMDDVRADRQYDYTSTWHWASIEEGKTYEETEQEEDGDVIWALEKLIDELKNGKLTETEEREKLKFVMHMIGDIHQPMHVGTGEDRGGNDVRVQWMGEPSNLHRVWDSNIIESFQMSYTEFGNELNTATPDQVEEWQNSTVRDWAYESVDYRDRMYDLTYNMRLGYDYRYANKDIVFVRLLQAGVRLAGVLNELYGE